MDEKKDLLTEKVIGLAIDVHRALGPGLLESAYEECLHYEINKAGIVIKRQLILPITYKEIRLAEAYRIDLLVDERLILELKTVDSMRSLCLCDSVVAVF
jgi:GxxExxY protein